MGFIIPLSRPYSSVSWFYALAQNYEPEIENWFVSGFDAISPHYKNPVCVLSDQELFGSATRFRLVHICLVVSGKIIVCCCSGVVVVLCMRFLLLATLKP